MTLSEATLNGARIVYDVAGHGPPCIAIHGGLGLDHSYMRAAMQPFEPQNTVIYVDLRGNGRSERVDPATITMEQLAADIDALREHLGADTIGVCGHSYGGFVALQHAVTYPGTLSHLALLDTSPGIFEPTPEEEAERPDPSTISPRVQEAAPHMSPLPTDDAGLKLWFEKVASVYLKDADPAILHAAVAETVYAVSAMHRSYEILSGWSVTDRLADIDVPTLVGCGRYDLITTPECSARLAASIPGAELVWFEDSGHFPWLEEPDAFATAIGAWLGRVL